MVTQKDNLAQPLDFQRYRYLRQLLGLVPSSRGQQGVQEFLRLLTPTRDVEATRLLVEPTLEQVDSANGTAFAQQVADVPAGQFDYVLACSCEHNDAGTNRFLSIAIRDGAAGNQCWIEDSNGTAMVADIPLALSRPLLLPQGMRIYCETGQLGIAAGSRVRLNVLRIRLTVGEYILGLP